MLHMGQVLGSIYIYLGYLGTICIPAYTTRQHKTLPPMAPLVHGSRVDGLSIVMLKLLLHVVYLSGRQVAS